jgi:hypothetical protein
LILPEQAKGNAFGKTENSKKYYDINGIDKEWLDNHATSGGSILKVTNAMIDTVTMEVPETASVIVEDIAEGRRRLAPNQGVLKAKVVRVTAQKTDGTLVSPTASAAQLRDDIFLDSSCLSSQYNACSKGKLTIPEGPIEEITIAADPTADAKQTLENLATAAVDRTGFDLVMFCQPPGTTGWIAYAYINSWNSYYNNDWCRYVSAQLHEVGHNLVRDDEAIEIFIDLYSQT